HRGGGQVGEDEGELVGALPPVRGDEHRAEPARGEQALLQPDGVAPDVADPVAAADAGRGQRVRQPVHPVAAVGGGGPPRAVHGGRTGRPGAPVLAQDVAEGESMDGHAASGGGKRTGEGRRAGHRKAGMTSAAKNSRTFFISSTGIGRVLPKSQSRWSKPISRSMAIWPTTRSGSPITSSCSQRKSDPTEPPLR